MRGLLLWGCLISGVSLSMLRIAGIGSWCLSPHSLERGWNSHSSWMHGLHLLAASYSISPRGFSLTVAPFFFFCILLKTFGLGFWFWSLYYLMIGRKRKYPFSWQLRSLKEPRLVLWLNWPLNLTQGISYMCSISVHMSLEIYLRLFSYWMPLLISFGPSEINFNCLKSSHPLYISDICVLSFYCSTLSDILSLGICVMDCYGY